MSVLVSNLQQDFFYFPVLPPPLSSNEVLVSKSTFLQIRYRGGHLFSGIQIALELVFHQHLQHIPHVECLKGHSHEIDLMRMSL
jgi:hypothetical protein